MRVIYSADVEYDILASKVHRWGEIVRFGGNFSIPDVEDDINNVIEMIIYNRDEVIKKTFSKKNLSNVKQFEIESVDICILSLIIGIDLGLPRESLMDLGVAGIIKDLGMNMVPHEILSKEESLTEEEYAKIKMHIDYSKEILAKLGFKQEIIDIVADHHERIDGKGYPRGKTGDQIHFLAKIISVVDGFNAIKAHRPYRKPLEGYDAIKSIISDSGKRYDSIVLKDVIKSLGVYPVGTYVALNDASICKVVKVNKKKPLKPVVQLLITKDGIPSHSNIKIDISDNPKYFIVRSVSVE